MEFTITPDHELKIIRYKHSGTLKRNDIGKAWEELLIMKEFTRDRYNLLSDYSEAIFDMPMDEAYEIVEILRSMGSVLKGKKQAIIINDEYSTAGSILFEHISQQTLDFIIKIFSTKEAALNWIVR